MIFSFALPISTFPPQSRSTRLNSLARTANIETKLAPSINSQNSCWLRLALALAFIAAMQASVPSENVSESRHASHFNDRMCLCISDRQVFSLSAQGTLISALAMSSSSETLVLGGKVASAFFSIRRCFICIQSVANFRKWKIPDLRVISRCFPIREGRSLRRDGSEPHAG